MAFANTIEHNVKTSKSSFYENILNVLTSNNTHVYVFILSSEKKRRSIHCTMANANVFRYAIEKTERKQQFSSFGSWTHNVLTQIEKRRSVLWMHGRQRKDTENEILRCNSKTMFRRWQMRILWFASLRLLYMIRSLACVGEKTAVRRNFWKKTQKIELNSCWLKRTSGALQKLWFGQMPKSNQ